MRRAAWIFFALILLPSLVLAWLAVRSVRDQQVVLEHQQAIICQNITDTLAKNIQGQMDGVRADFVKTTEQLLGEKASQQVLAQNFNRTLREAWPMAEIGFAVNLTGEIYSPVPYDGPEARTFRDENDRFLSNRENVEVYSSNVGMVTQSSAAMKNNVAQNAVLQNAASQFTLKLPEQVTQVAAADKVKKEMAGANDLQSKLKSMDARVATEAKDEQQQANQKASGSMRGSMERTDSTKMASATATDREASGASADSAATNAVPASAPAPAPVLDSSTLAPKSPAPVVAPDSLAMTRSAPAPIGGESQTMAVPTTTVITPTAPALIDSSSSAPATESSQDMPSVFGKIARSVVPQQVLSRDTASLSNTVPEESDFRRIIGTEASGELARFLENKMRLLVWLHPSADAPIVFGAQLNPDKLVETLQTSLQVQAAAGRTFDRFSSSYSTNSSVCAAILDDAGHPIALSRPGFVADWKHPFVATEIGEVLPHWEAALYLVDPQQFSRAARTLQWAFFAIVLLLVASILAGGSAIGRDVRREMRLAQQKTDFVSNVSHELKTPLTSIRMFADLLAENRVPDPEKQATYLRIIAAEASRLTRLINNVLDFARLEKGAPHGEHAACDLVEAVRDVADTCGPHLEAAGVSFLCEIEVAMLPIRGDRDALAQIILNLISNAEKYGGNDILVRVRRQEIATGALGCVDVLDRGAGIPARQAKTIFEPFHRLDDSLSSGIPGSGLGLTLARRMARVHGGDVTYSARAGGGSCFTLVVPLV